MNDFGEEQISARFVSLSNIQYIDTFKRSSTYLDFPCNMDQQSMKTSYLVLSSVDLDQITPLNWLPLPFLISFGVVWIKVYLLVLCLLNCVKRLILSITIY